ncbi:MAG TPA: IS481 family transposase [Rhodocyclaceae bacterium]|nr:IS481 family transposase [Rhodocyclaceae bacterium]
MPWKEVRPMDEKVLFIADHLRQVGSFSELCGRYGISRKTGYKWVERYQREGADGLVERSRKPHSRLQETPYSVRQAILELREQRDPPGPKKIQALLAQRFEADVVPSKTTIYNILKRAGKVVPQRRSKRFKPIASELKSADQPNELWSADYKGQFKTQDGRWCYPLTVMDHASRYLLGCQGLEGTRYEDTRAVFERLFREFGLPERIRTDNGTPFVTLGVGHLSRLAVWWIRLGIRPERIQPGQPQQNGRHERMHRTLKRALGTPLAADLTAQQIHLDQFRAHYNDQRPHEGLAQRSPVTHYAPSVRAYPARLPELEYPGYFECKRVSRSGLVYWQAMTIYIGNLLADEWIGIEATADGIWDVYFGPVRLGYFDERETGGRRDNYVTLKV